MGSGARYTKGGAALRLIVSDELWLDGSIAMDGEKTMRAAPTRSGSEA